MILVLVVVVVMANNSGKSNKEGVEGTQLKVIGESEGQDWEKEKGKRLDLSSGRRQWKPVFDDASVSHRPLKKIRSPEPENPNQQQQQQPSSMLSLQPPSSRIVFPFAFGGVNVCIQRLTTHKW